MSYWKTKWNENQKALQKYGTCIYKGTMKAEGMKRLLREYDLAALMGLSALDLCEVDEIIAAEDDADEADRIIDEEFQRRLACNAYYLGFLRAARYFEKTKKPLDAGNGLPTGWVYEHGTDAIKPFLRMPYFFAEDGIETAEKGV